MTAIKTSLKASLIATAIAMLPFGAHAAGLGSITVFSGLGQPLRAEIKLNATPQELESLSARIASTEAFRQANVPYSPVMSALRLAVERRGTGAVVRISSERPLNDPFVDLLLELDWASGRLIREYTFLLDPVPSQAPAPVAAQVAAPSVTAASAARSSTTGSTERSGSSAPERYEVRRGDTLHGVAEAHRPESASLDQMLIALFRDNPDAFDGGNINRLRAGAILTVPSDSAVLSVEPTQARREVTAQAADFDAYRKRLAGASVSRPASSEAPSSRADAGAIVPKVDDGGAAGGLGDRVKVSTASEAATSQAAGDGARLARLQALEEELVARDKALEEAHARLAALETSIREMQQLLELRNQGLGQLQQQANGPEATGSGVDEAAPQVAEAPPSPKPEAAPVPAPLAGTPAVEQPGFVEAMLQDPKMLAGGGGILALLLGYAGLKVRRRRDTKPAGVGRQDLTADLPPVTNSVFGATGGQNVNTSDTSIIHTDFSQSGLSAIDTDEGVDPVAEADVYMAYGRDIQAEEILLDALKSESARPAIFLKLLEIYEQRKSVKQFEATAADLYSRTAGEGSDWQKAVEMGRRIDPANPLYGAAAASSRGAKEAVAAGAETGARPAVVETGAGLAALAAASSPASAGDSEADVGTLDDVRPDLDFTPSSAVIADASLSWQPKDGSEVPAGDSADVQSVLLDLGEGGDAGADASDAASESAVLEALPEIDSSALDFDRDAGLGLEVDFPALGDDSAPAPESSMAPTVTPLGDFELDLDAEGETAPAFGTDASMSATIVGDVGDLVLPAPSIEFDLSTEDGQALTDTVSAEPDREFAPAADSVRESNASDLEETTFDSSLLDFDFNLEETDSIVAESTPAFDLPGLDLDLDAAAPQPDAAVEATDISTEIPRTATAELSEEALQEVATKLELARAYDEMGDKDGARELIEEVLREGSPDQQAAGRRLLERLV